MHFISYDVGPDDVITGFGGEWIDFALDNGAPSLADVVGCSLWDFISGMATREAYRDILGRVRRGQEIHFPFRCDSPHVIREMAMIMRSPGGGDVRFESFLLATRPRVDLRTPPAEGPIRICSWCRRMASPGGWHYPRFAIEALMPFDMDHPSRVRYGVCPTCAQMLSIAPEP